MPVNDELGKRMKEYYEQIPKSKLMRRTPVAIRIDGKAFHTFCRCFDKPFDDMFIDTMQRTTKYLCENIQGCVFGYTQSDEITLILIDYKKLNSSAWFDYEVQKICSIAASMATLEFNRQFMYGLEEHTRWVCEGSPTARDKELQNIYYDAMVKGAMFDARCFNIPKEEVANLIYWRQLDATRNSIQMVGQANFSHKELQNKSCNDIQDMLLTKRDINWNDFPIYKKRDSACFKQCIEIGEICSMELEPNVESLYKSEWIIDKEMPILKGDNREYVEKHIFVGE